MQVTSIFLFFLKFSSHLHHHEEWSFWKHFGKKNKGWYPAFFLFPQCLHSFHWSFKSHYYELCSVFRLQMLSIFFSFVWYILEWKVNSFPNGKILALTKWKAFADDKFASIMMFASDRQENIVGKGENAGYQHFLLFPQCFQKPSFVWSWKPGIVWEMVNHSNSHFIYLVIQW